jgi:hypothetical protein
MVKCHNGLFQELVKNLAAKSSVNKAPNMAKLQTAAVIVIAITITLASLYYIGFFNELQASPANTTTSQTTLTPARKLEGKWKTTFPVKFFIKTDFDTGELQDIGSENRTITWIITPTSDDNVVDVEVTFTFSNRQFTGSGYTPDVSPSFYTGTISGTRLTLTTGDKFSESGTVGEFTFTTDIITGTWNDQWSIAYEQQVYTSTNSLILSRQ